MFCERCGNPLEDSDKFCAKCGAPVTLEEAKEPETPEETKTPEEAKEPEKPETPMIPAAPVETPASAANLSTGESEAPKKKRKAAPFIVIGAAILAVLIVCVVCGAQLVNQFRKNFFSPEKYYQYVEQTVVEEIAQQGGAYYERLLLDFIDIGDRSIGTELTLEISEAGKDFLKLLGAADVDLSWLEQMSFGAGFSLKDKVLKYDISLGLNRTGILSANVVMDMDSGKMYLQLPELTPEYIGLDFSKINDGYEMDNFEEYLEMQESLNALRKALPDAKEVEKLLNKYLGIALSAVTDVEKKSATVKAGGVRQKCTELEVTLDGKGLTDVLEAVLKEMAGDKDLKKLIIDTADALMEIEGFYYGNEDGEDVYAEFAEELEEALEKLDEVRDEMRKYKGELVMHVYVDGRGEIVGRVVEVVEDREVYFTVSSLMPENSGSVGYEFSMEQGYGQKIALVGSGKRSGNTLKGDFTLEYMGMSIFDMKVSGLNVEQLKQGYLNGSFTITPSAQIGTLLSAYLPYGSAYRSAFTDIQLTLDSQMSKDSGKLTLGLIYDGEKLGSISMSADTGAGSQGNLPDQGKTVFVEGEEDLTEWLEKIDWDKFLEKLEKANLPDEVMEEIEDFVDLVTYYGVDGLISGY